MITLGALGKETFDFNVLLSFAMTLIVCDTFTVTFTFNGIFQGMTLDTVGPKHYTLNFTLTFFAIVIKSCLTKNVFAGKCALAMNVNCQRDKEDK